MFQNNKYVNVMKKLMYNFIKLFMNWSLFYLKLRNKRKRQQSISFPRK